MPQLTVAKQQVDDQQQHDPGRTEDRTGVHVPKAGPQSLLQAEVFKRPLKDHQTREGGQLLVFKTKDRKGMGFAANLRSAKLHDKRFCCWVSFCFGEHILPQQQTAFSLFCIQIVYFPLFLDHTGSAFQKPLSYSISPSVLCCEMIISTKTYATGRLSRITHSLLSFHVAIEQWRCIEDVLNDPV
jgi:hypothetical protein